MVTSMSVGSVVVEQDVQSAVAHRLDQSIQECRGIQIDQVRVQVRVDPACGGAVNRGGANRYPDRVGADGLDLVQHVAPRPRPQAMRGMGFGLEAKPVDASQLEGIAVRVNQPAVLGAIAGGEHGGERK